MKECTSEQRFQPTSGNDPDRNKKLTSSYLTDIKRPESCPILKQIYYSRAYKYFYLLLLATTLVLTIWIIADYDHIHGSLILSLIL